MVSRATIARLTVIALLTGNPEAYALLRWLTGKINVDQLFRALFGVDIPIVGNGSWWDNLTAEMDPTEFQKALTQKVSDLSQILGEINQEVPRFNSISGTWRMSHLIPCQFSEWKPTKGIYEGLCSMGMTSEKLTGLFTLFFDIPRENLIEEMCEVWNFLYLLHTKSPLVSTCPLVRRILANGHGDFAKSSSGNVGGNWLLGGWSKLRWYAFFCAICDQIETVVQSHHHFCEHRPLDSLNEEDMAEIVEQFSLDVRRYISRTGQAIEDGEPEQDFADKAVKLVEMTPRVVTIPMSAIE